jgi:hypothetical protein
MLNGAGMETDLTSNLQSQDRVRRARFVIGPFGSAVSVQKGSEGDAFENI